MRIQLKKDEADTESESAGHESTTKRNRVNQQRKDCSLSIILIVTVIMFFIFHTPRSRLPGLVQDFNSATVFSHLRFSRKK